LTMKRKKVRGCQSNSTSRSTKLEKWERTKDVDLYVLVCHLHRFQFLPSTTTSRANA
jgi:hypothetical protein